MTQDTTPPQDTEYVFEFKRPHRTWDMEAGTSTSTALATLLETPSPKEMARHIDHTILKPHAQVADILRLCDEAMQHDFYSVCVNGSYAKLAATALVGSMSKVCVVVGFPLGASTPSSKAYEAAQAISHGAEEIDMVINIGALKDGDYALVGRDIEMVVRASNPFPVKVILETGLLTDEEKKLGCALAKSAGAAFVKTSTGFGHGGATVEDVRLMRHIVKDDVGVKASGGIRDYETACAMIEAGANRLGCSSGVAIVSGDQGQSDY